MCPKFQTNPAYQMSYFHKFVEFSKAMPTKCHISTNLSNFLKLCLYIVKNYLPLFQQIADLLKKIGLVRTLSRTFSIVEIADPPRSFLYKTL